MRTCAACFVALAVTTLCADGRVSAQSPPQSPATVSLLLDTGDGVPAGVADAVDEAVLAAVDETSCCQAPAVSPAPYLDVQLTVGCEGDTSECLSAIAQMAEVDLVIVRRLSVDASGTTTLQLISGRADAAHGVEAVQATRGAAARQELIGETRGLVRKLVGGPNEAESDVGQSPAVPGQPVASSTESAPAPLDAADSLPEDAPSETPGPVQPVTWIVGGVGVAILAAGAVVGLLASGAFDDVKKTEVQTHADADRVHSDLDAAGDQATLANVLLPVGGAVLTAGIVLLFMDLSSEPGEPSLAVAADHHGLAVTVRGRFGAY